MDRTGKVSLRKKDRKRGIGRCHFADFGSCILPEFNRKVPQSGIVGRKPPSGGGHHAVCRNLGSHRHLGSVTSIVMVPATAGSILSFYG